LYNSLIFCGQTYSVDQEPTFSGPAPQSNEFGLWLQNIQNCLSSGFGSTALFATMSVWFLKCKDLGCIEVNYCSKASIVIKQPKPCRSNVAHDNI